MILQTLISNGHSYSDILEHYTPPEIEAFYRACVAREQRSVLDHAVAARVSQADKKGWTDFTKDVEKSIKKLTKVQEREVEKGRKMSTGDLANFFAQIGKSPTVKSLREGKHP